MFFFGLFVPMIQQLIAAWIVGGAVVAVATLAALRAWWQHEYRRRRNELFAGLAVSVIKALLEK